MKKIISILLAVILTATVFTALPMSVGAAETGEAVSDKPIPDIFVANGTFGENDCCSWALDLNNKLIISGTGSTGNYSTEAKPWAEYNDQITEVVIMNGVTTLGRGVFSNTTNLAKVSMAPSVTTIDRDAFWNCKALTTVELTDSVASIGIAAFLNTGLKSITIPNKNCYLDSYSIGYYSGKNLQTLKRNGFLIYGHTDSTAQSYAGSNGFTFIDIDAEPLEVYSRSGSIDNLTTGETDIYCAYPGERLKVTLNEGLMDPFEYLMEYYAEYRDSSVGHYVRDESVVFDENGCFTMPERNIAVDAEMYHPQSLDIYLSEGYCSITNDQYTYLAGLIDNHELSGRAKSNRPGEYFIYLADDTELSLTPEAVAVYDYDYQNSYSFRLPRGHQYNPVNFIFAEKKVKDSSLTLTIPEGGTAWDYETMMADLTTDDDEYYVLFAIWYDKGGVSAFDTFKGNELYYCGFDLMPKNGYYFTMASEVHVSSNDIVQFDYETLYPQYMNEDGSIHYSTMKHRVVGGESHSINVVDGWAKIPGTNTRIEEAVPGQEVYVKYDVNTLADDEYIILDTITGQSNDCDIWDTDLIGTSAFYMPDNDVTVTMVFERGIQKNTVMPLYSGPFTLIDDYSNTSEAFGARCVLNATVEHRDYDGETGTSLYDIDGNGSWDVQMVNNVYTLLPTSSLTKNTKLTMSREESATIPVRSVEIQVVEPVKHKITVTGGGAATTKRGDFANEYVITEAYEGQTVFLIPKLSEIDPDSYIVQFSMSATSNDVAILDDAVPEFVMPDKDVTIAYDFDCRVQKNSTLEFFIGYPTYINPEPELPYPATESYGVYAAIWKYSAAEQDSSEFGRQFDVDGDGNFDIEYDINTEFYTLLDTNSLPSGYKIELTREQSWTAPVRSVTITYREPEPPKRGDVNFDGKVTIEDATMLQMHFAEFLNPNNGPIIDESDPDWFWRCDANGDNKLNIRDVTAIQRIVAEFTA